MKRLTVAAIAALAIAATVPTTSKADEPDNPVKGAVRRIYNFSAGHSAWNLHAQEFSGIAKKIKSGAETAYMTGVDTGDVFKTESANTYHRDIGMWTGFLKRNAGGEYTLVFSTNSGKNLYPVYSVWLNGRQIVDAQFGTTAVDVVLNAGFNEIVLVSEGTEKYYTMMSIKKKDSLKDSTSIGPGNLWHENEPDDEDEDDE